MHIITSIDPHSGPRPMHIITSIDKTVKLLFNCRIQAMGSVKEVITLPSPASMTPMALCPTIGWSSSHYSGCTCLHQRMPNLLGCIYAYDCTVLTERKKPNYTNDYHTTTNINYHYVLTSIPHHAKTLMMPSRPFTADGDTFLQLPCLTPH